MGLQMFPNPVVSHEMGWLAWQEYKQICNLKSTLSHSHILPGKIMKPRLLKKPFCNWGYSSSLIFNWKQLLSYLICCCYQCWFQNEKHANEWKFVYCWEAISLDTVLHMAWWRHQMEIFSTLVALYVGNSPVTGDFPAQRPVTRSFDVFFDLRLNKRLSKQSRDWRYETPSLP